MNEPKKVNLVSSKTAKTLVRRGQIKGKKNEIAVDLKADGDVILKFGNKLRFYGVQNGFAVSAEMPCDPLEDV